MGKQEGPELYTEKGGVQVGRVWAKGFQGAVVTVSSACAGPVSQWARCSHGNGLSVFSVPRPGMAPPRAEVTCVLQGKQLEGG